LKSRQIYSVIILCCISILNAVANLDSVKMAFYNKQYKKAIEIAERELNSEGLTENAGWYLYYAAKSYEALKNFDVAVQYYIKIIDFFPGTREEALAHYSLGNLYFNDGDYIEANNHLIEFAREIKYGYKKEIQQAQKMLKKLIRLPIGKMNEKKAKHALRKLEFALKRNVPVKRTSKKKRIYKKNIISSVNKKSVKNPFKRKREKRNRKKKKSYKVSPGLVSVKSSIQRLQGTPYNIYDAKTNRYFPSFNAIKFKSTGKKYPHAPGPRLFSPSKIFPSPTGKYKSVMVPRPYGVMQYMRKLPDAQQPSIMLTEETKKALMLVAQNPHFQRLLQNGTIARLVNSPITTNTIISMMGNPDFQALAASGEFRYLLLTLGIDPDRTNPVEIAEKLLKDVRIQALLRQMAEGRLPLRGMRQIRRYDNSSYGILSIGGRTGNLTGLLNLVGSLRNMQGAGLSNSPFSGLGSPFFRSMGFSVSPGSRFSTYDLLLQLLGN